MFLHKKSSKIGRGEEFGQKMRSGKLPAYLPTFLFLMNFVQILPIFQKFNLCVTYGWMDGPMDGQTDGPMDGRMDSLIEMWERI